MLPECFADIAYVKGFRDVEQAQRGSNGSTLKGKGLDVPLSVLSQQRLHVLKYFLKVPEHTAPAEPRCAKETLIEASRRAGCQRFWPTPNTTASKRTPSIPVLYSDGPNQVIPTATATATALPQLLDFYHAGQT